MLQNSNNFKFFCEESYMDLNTVLNVLEIPISNYDKNEDFIYLEKKQYINISDERRELAFRFVGTIVLQEKVICIFPKYYHERIKYDTILNDKEYERYFSEFVQIIKVIKKYRGTKSKEPLKKYDLTNSSEQNEMIIADGIIEDYILNGIYSKQRDDVAFNLDGNIDWNRTVNELQPIFSKNRPIYSDVVVNLLVTEEDYIITLLHKWAVKYCLNKYGQLLDYDSSVFQDDAVNELSDIGNNDFLKNILRKELNETFIDRNINTIKLLRSLITKEFEKNKTGISLFGTKSFHSIWQEVCSVVFKNDLGETFPGKKQTFKELLLKPVWIEINTKEEDEDATLIPDIICVNYTTKNFFILDPKYYKTSFKDVWDAKQSKNVKKIIENPGVGDVTKQILYEHAFRHVFETEFDHWYNILVFPKLDLDQPKWEFYGSVRFNLKIFTDNVVWLMYIDPKNLYLEYLSATTTWGRSQLEKISTKIETEKLKL